MRRWLIRVGLVLGVVLAAGSGGAASANASALCPWDGHGWFHAGLAGADIVAVLEEGGVSTTGRFVCAAEVDDALLIVSLVDDDYWRYPVLGNCARGYYILGRPEEFTDDQRPFDTNQNGLICARRFVPLPVGPETRLISEYADDQCPDVSPCVGFDPVEGLVEERWSDGVLTGWNTSGSGPGTSLAIVPLARDQWVAELANTGATASTCTLNDSPNVVRTTAETGTYMYRLHIEPETSGQTLRLRVREYRGSERVGSKTTDVRLWPRGSGAAVITYTPVAPGESTLDFNASVVNAASGRCFRASTLGVLTGSTPPPPEPRSNFLANDGFEFDRSGWTTTDGNAGIALTRAYGGHTGHWAAHLTNTGTTAATCGLNDSPNSVRSTSAGPYEASLWVRADTAGATLKLRLMEWSGGVLAGSARTAVTLTTEWQLVTVSYTPSAPGVSALDLSAYVVGVPPGTCFYADDASVVHISGSPEADPD